jgi:ribose transport system ATP-binding protein
MREIVKTENISKNFGGVHALRDVSVSIQQGEVHVIAGENGAGKSTFIKILSGVYKPNAGKVFIGGSEVEHFVPLNAIKAGIAPIFQESSVYENQSVVENIYVVNKLKKQNSPFLDWKAMEEECRTIFSDLEEDINVRDNLLRMTAGRKKIIEIARALVQDAKCVIMDEPTSSLSEKEVTKLFKQIRMLKERGIAIIYITHKLDEIYEIGDKISVFRDGMLVGTENVKTLEREKLIQMMIDRTLSQYFPEIIHKIGGPVLEISHITSEYGLFHDVSFTICKGEIVGLYGLVGAGRSELAQAVFGIDRNKRGTVKLNGKPLNVKTANQAIAHGIAYLPEDRQSQGLVIEMDVKSNITLSILKKLVHLLFINGKKELAIAKKSIDRLRIMTTGPEQIVNNLSGGNQQKVLVSKWLNVEPTVLILDEPTRGIDVGTKTEIYNLIKSLAEKGIAILLISSELPEIMGMSHRVIVMNSGSIVSEFKKQEISKEKIIKAALKEQV